jgi:hypothetical protein
MPIGRLIVEQNSQTEELRKKLTHEWQQPSHAAQPVLIEAAGDRMSGSKQLYVIWDDWVSLDQRERSEIIMDAYEATHERPDVLSVTVAMGVTAKEAERMGIRYETEPA